MKTLKNRFATGLILLIALAPFAFTGCTNDNPDLRDEIVGEYDYLVKIYSIAPDGTLVYLGNQGDNYDIEGTMRITKGAGIDMLDFWDGNVRMFYAENLIDRVMPLFLMCSGRKAGSVRSMFRYQDLMRFRAAHLYTTGLSFSMMRVLRSASRRG